MAARVREQYERHPYPAWTTPARRSEQLRASVAPPTRALIAGCGTGRDACSVALTFPDASILAIDLSAASLREAALHADELAMPQITFARRDLLDPWDERFDLVLAVGVLHHLDDPAAGMAALASALAPDGRLVLGMYSLVGRHHVLHARQVALDLGYDGDDPGRFRRDAATVLPADTYAALARYPDLHYDAGVRDLIFPAREVYLEPAQIAAALADAGLVVERMLVPPSVLATFETEVGGDPRDLRAWGEFEEAYPDTFRAMYRLVAAPTSA
jgi:SAM-dependent methyltransferase